MMSDSYAVIDSVSECIDVKPATINTRGGLQPVFILELHANDIKLPIIKYFNVKQTPKGNYTVKENSDFAKTYRLTIGEVKKERFYRSQHLLSHFLGARFRRVEYEIAYSKKVGQYLKVTHFEPVNPLFNEAWTATGKLKKVRKQPVFTEADSAELTQNLRRKYAESTQNFRSEEKLEAAKTLGLQPFSIPLQHTPYNIAPLHHALEGEDKKPETAEVEIQKPEIQKPVNRAFYHKRLPSETVDEFYDRVIDETFLSDVVF